MKLHHPFLFVLVAKVGNAARCGCDSCTQEIWESIATDASGSYTCGGRINWLQTARGFDEESACIKVSNEEFPDGPCGPACDPTRCDPPTPAPTPPPTPEPTARCGCDTCTQEVWDSLATDASGSYTCGGRINWLQTAQGFDEASACIKVSNEEFPDGPCGPACDPTRCDEPAQCDDVDFTGSPSCQTDLWGPPGTNTQSCYLFEGRPDPCQLNNNDENEGLFKDPSLCFGDTFYLWDEPDTRGRDYAWAGREWLGYSERFAQELEVMRSRGTTVTGPLLKAGTGALLELNMLAFYDACGDACLDPSNPAFIDAVATSSFCGSCRGLCLIT